MTRNSQVHNINMIMAGVVLTQCQRLTDRQTDGFTIANTALSIASYADAL